MSKFFKTFSLTPQKLRYKLGIAFFLMSLIPLFVCAFFVLAYIYPETRYDFTIGSTAILVIIGITLFITILGFSVVRQIVDPVVTIANKAKQVAEGRTDAAFDIVREDEIGDLSDSLNKMTSRIKETISELHSYSEKTKEINIEIQQKVLTLSNLLQIGNLISAGTPLEEVIGSVIEKLGQLDMTSSSFIYLLESEGVLARKWVQNIELSLLSERISFGNGILGKVASQGDTLIVDAKASSGLEVKELRYSLRLKNLAVFPITSRGSVVGLLGTGNTLDPFTYRTDDLETIRVFVKQISIAVENDFLTKRAKELQMKDELTKLYNEKFTRQRLEEEIKRAIRYQRPCSLILVDIDNFQTVKTQSQPELLKQMAKEIEKQITDVDRAARFDRDLFALIVPEKNKKEATQLAEMFRRTIEQQYGGGKGFQGQKITVSAGVSENPIDGATAETLIQKAKEALSTAKSLGKNRVAA